MENKLQKAEEAIGIFRAKLAQAEKDLDKAIIEEAKRVLKKAYFEFSDHTKMYYNKKTLEFVQVFPDGNGKCVQPDLMPYIYKVNPKFRAFLKTY